MALIGWRRVAALYTILLLSASAAHAGSERFRYAKSIGGAQRYVDTPGYLFEFELQGEGIEPGQAEYRLEDAAMVRAWVTFGSTPAYGNGYLKEAFVPDGEAYELQGVSASGLLTLDAAWNEYRGGDKPNDTGLSVSGTESQSSPGVATTWTFSTEYFDFISNPPDFCPTCDAIAVLQSQQEGDAPATHSQVDNRFRFASALPLLRYSLRQIPYNGTSMQARDINDHGLIVGDVENNSNQHRGFYFSNGFIAEIGVMTSDGSGESSASAINNGGVVVGSASVDGNAYPDNQSAAYTWEWGTQQSLADILGYSGDEPFAYYGLDINNDGDVLVAASDLSPGVYYEGQGHWLMPTYGSSSDIADRSPGTNGPYMVVRRDDDFSGNPEVFVYDGVQQSTGVRGYSYSGATVYLMDGITGNGAVFGNCSYRDGDSFLYGPVSCALDATEFSADNYLPGFYRDGTDIRDMSDSGWSLHIGEYRNWSVYSEQHDLAVDLRPAGWTEVMLESINETGDIVGWGRNAYGIIRSFLVEFEDATMDAVPFSKTNPVDLASNGDVGVLLLNTSRSDGDKHDFDPQGIPLYQLRFGASMGPGAPLAADAVYRDVDNDGDDDLQLLFNIQESGIACIDTQVWLRGRDGDDKPFIALDAVSPVNCESGNCHP